MNKTRLKKLEEKAEDRIEKTSGLPGVWRPEEGKIAIQESPFILGRLNSLRREIVYSPYIFTAVLVSSEDSEIIDRVEGRKLFLKGLSKPISGIAELTFIGNE
jgi:hypothetical protein